MGDERLQNSYNDLLERYKSLSSSYNKMRAQAECDTAKAKRTVSTCKNIVFVLLLIGGFAVTKFLDAEYERGKANGIEYAKEELVDAAYKDGYEAGKSDTLDEHSGDYDNGYDTGYEDAVSKLEYEYAEKIDDTYDAAYEEGYEAGYEDGTVSSVTYSNNGGTSTSEPSSPSNVTSATQVVETPAPTVPTYDYIINTNTGKFHYPWCSSVGQMKESNKWYYNGTHDDVVNMGYVPCRRCCP